MERRNNRKRRAKFILACCVSFPSLVSVLLFLSSKKRYRQTEEEEEKTKVQTEKQHTAQQFHPLPSMTTLESTNEYTHLSIPTAYIRESSDTIKKERLHFFILLDNFFFFLTPETTSSSMITFESIRTYTHTRIYIYAYRKRERERKNEWDNPLLLMVILTTILTLCMQACILDESVPTVLMSENTRKEKRREREWRADKAWMELCSKSFCCFSFSLSFEPKNTSIKQSYPNLLNQWMKQSLNTTKKKSKLLFFHASSKTNFVLKMKRRSNRWIILQCRCHRDIDTQGCLIGEYKCLSGA